ncbi:MAG: ribose 5-phosphate isomerase B [Anaerolineae bacterium]|nr:ribose 5-phosphate isomerase B [Anaerolineae bacterium]
MRVAIAGDHRGYHLKEEVAAFIQAQGHEALNLGAFDVEISDYPDFAKAIGEALQRGDAERGVLICGSGVGASVAANKVKGIRAAICHDVYSAGQGVMHDDMNVLCLGADIIGVTQAKELVKAFLGATFLNEGRYRRRLEKVLAMEAASCGQ